jgi:hypothetical protein
VPLNQWTQDSDMETGSSTAMQRSPHEEAELAYCYFGFASSLRRYRRMTVLGWVVVAAGFLSLMIGWREGTPHGLLDLVLSVLAIAAGIGLVQQSVMSLEAYVRSKTILFAAVPATNRPPAINEMIALMDDVETGGWQEAYAALGKLRTLGTVHGLPVP